MLPQIYARDIISEGTLQPGSLRDPFPGLTLVSARLNIPRVFGDMLGKNLSHYRIVQQIGAGGMGVVFLAYDEQLERDVAIKILPPGTLADDVAPEALSPGGLAG